MDGTVKWVVGTAVTLLIAILGSTYALFATSQSGQQAINNHLIAFTDRLSAVENRLSAVENRLSAVETEVGSLRDDVSELTMDVAQVKTDLAQRKGAAKGASSSTDQSF